MWTIFSVSKGDSTIFCICAIKICEEGRSDMNVEKNGSREQS